MFAGVLRRLVAAVAIALLAGGPIVLPAAAADLVPTVTMTTVNWGAPVSLLDPRHPAWAHPAGVQGRADVVVTVELHGLLVQHWAMAITAPDSTQVADGMHCEGDEPAVPRPLQCTFVIAPRVGVNALRLVVSADGHTIAAARGSLRAGTMRADPAYEVLDATGAWVAIAHDQAVTLLATSSTAIRYVVVNSGTIPLRLVGGCSNRTIAPGATVVCALRGIRPAQSLAREYVTPVQLEDAAGGGSSYVLRASIRTFAGSFELSRSQLAPAGIAVVTGAGLPTDGAFSMQFQVDSRSTFLGTSTTRAGETRVSFPLPHLAVGPAHLNVVHDGVTIASLPFTVTRAPAAEAAPSTWPWLFLLVPLGAFLVVMRRRIRTRARPRPDPSQVASLATPEHEVARLP